MLTQSGDMVLDVFAGSNTTGQVAEAEGRHWLSFELSREYVSASAFRFLTKDNATEDMREIYGQIESGASVNISNYKVQINLLTASAS